MTEHWVSIILVAVFQVLMGIVGYFLRDTVKRIEKDQEQQKQEIRVFREKMDELKTNYLQRFEEVKQHQTNNFDQIKSILAAGNSRFEQIAGDIRVLTSTLVRLEKDVYDKN